MSEETEGKVVLELRDAFGGLYEVSALDRKTIERILENVDIGDVVMEAYGRYCPGLADGVAWLDIQDGTLTGGTYTTGSGDIQGAHYIYLYSVGQNLDLPAEDILTEEEQEKYYEEPETSIKEFCEAKGIDFEEREMDALVVYAYDTVRGEDWWRRVEEELDEIYKVIE
jgi:hypothetical protein